MTSAKHIKLFNRDGISQQQRRLVEIDPLYAKIDDRQFKDLLRFLWQIAEHIQYYDLAKSKSGNWQNFIGVEQAVLLALVATKDTSPLKYDFLDLHNEIQETVGGNAYLPIFDLLLQHALEWQELYNKTNRILGRELFLSQQNTQALESFISLLAGLYRGYAGLGDDSGEDSFTRKLVKFCDELGIEYSPVVATDFSGVSGHLLDKKIRVDLYELHQDLQKLFATIIGHADQLFDAALKRQGSHEPHIGLILTFLHLFKRYQDQFNNLTAQHLQFYYKDVLKIDYRDKVADKVNVIIQLAKKADMCNLSAGTSFKAGKDSAGKQLIYKAVDDFVANKAQIAELKSIYKAGDGELLPIGDTSITLKSIRSAQKADSLDGKEKPLDEDNPQFAPFGTRDLENGEIGFAFASPVLRLAGGKRTISILLTLEEKGGTDSALSTMLNDEDENILDFLFDVYLTCEKGWETIQKATENSSGTGNNIAIEIESESQLKITLSLGIDFPAVVDFSKETHSASFPERWPIVTFVLKQNQSATYYELCRRFKLKGYLLSVDVTELKNLVVQNDFGLQKLEKPTMPFGSQPVANAKFYIGSQEVFSKELDSLSVKWDWLEYKTFAERQNWYAAYTDPDGSPYFPDLPEEDVQVVFERLVDNAWVPLTDSGSQDEHFFCNSSGGDVDTATFELKNDTNSNKFKSITGFKKYDFDLQDGFIRIRLKNNAFLFGHDLYQEALLAPITTKFGVSEITTTPTKVNRPLTPVIENIQISYTSSVNHVKGETVQAFYHVHPFGYEPRKLIVTNDLIDVSLVPDYREEAALYIGFKEVKPAQNISMLFQFVEGTGDVNLAMPEKIEWSYLSEAGWQVFDERGVIKDSTKGFSGTGIVVLAIPKEAVDSNPLMTSSLYWVKASVAGNSRAVNMLASIKTQAMELEFFDQDNAPEHYETALPAEKISKLFSSVAQVKTVTQPFASFGNRPKEKKDTYNVRVSERLRHKDRAVTLWDYERLVLEAFPQIHKVKCLNHASEHSDIHPGHVQVVVIPNLENLNAVNLLKPAVSIRLRREIKEFLAKRCSKLVRLEISNPRYEEIQVAASVIFRDGLDIGYHNDLLSHEIKDFLTPWKSNREDIHFYEKLHSSVILNFIEERDYVDYLTRFSVTKKVDNQLGPTVLLGDIIRSRADSLFVSVEEHLINTT